MQRLAIAIVVGVVGCGGLPAPPARGVRERAVASVPVEYVATLPSRVPEPGRVRVGVVGVAAPERESSAKVGDGQQHVANVGGEAFVAVGLPGSYTSADESTRAGWEITVGAIGARAPSERAHDADAMLVAPDRALVGGSLQVSGTIGSEYVMTSASLGVRAVELPFVWDYGGCAGPGDCPVWNQKGAAEESSALAFGVSASLSMWKRMGRNAGWIVGAGFDLAPSIETSRVDVVQCDANGNCTGGKKPSPPGAEVGPLTGQLLIGADYRFLEWARAFVVLVTSKGASDTWEEHAHAGLEVTF
jgi:hypothetical protein